MLSPSSRTPERAAEGAGVGVGVGAGIGVGVGTGVGVDTGLAVGVGAGAGAIGEGAPAETTPTVALPDAVLPPHADSAMISVITDIWPEVTRKREFVSRVRNRMAVNSLKGQNGRIQPLTFC
jgi:hypothetical protein